MICVVTVYNSYNIGSYLQAKALKDVLCNYDEVTFLNTHSRSPLFKSAKAIIKGIIKGNPRRILLEIKKYKYFTMNQKDFKKVDLEKCPTDTIFIFGSDEIWNISREQMRRFPVFWGDGITGRKIAYAPSINQTTIDELKRWPYLEMLNGFSSIGVRDDYTRDKLSEVTGLKIERVVDPTMLLPIESYSSKTDDIKEKYIAVYMFEGRVSADHIKLLKEMAKNKGLALIGVGAQYDWCDESHITRNSFNLFEKAEYTAVNTFHGTVFSILYNKKFICFADNYKTRDLLHEFNLDDRAAETFDITEETRRIDKEIDYIQINEIIDQKREYSRQYIQKSLET